MTIDYLTRFKDKNVEDLAKKGLKVPKNKRNFFRLTEYQIMKELLGN